MKIHHWLSPLLVLVAQTAACASPSEEPSTPTQDEELVGALQGAERAEFMDAARAEFFKAVNRTTPVVFIVNELKVANGRDGSPYAFMAARPVKPGTAIDYDYSGTPIQEAIDSGLFDDNVAYVVQKKVNGHWKLLTMWLGPTDVPWTGMECSDGVPASILGMSPQNCSEYTGWAGLFQVASTNGGLYITFKSEHPLVFDIKIEDGNNIINARDLVPTAPSAMDPVWIDNLSFRRGDCSLTFAKRFEFGRATLAVEQTGACTSLGFTPGMDISADYYRPAH